MTLPPPSPAPLPPANIPPPSVLLPLFPPLFTQITQTLLQPLLALPPPSRQPRLLSSALASFLRSHLSALTVFTHILAARKLRWRRDKRLAQSMAIGPSVSGRSGGMKLAGVDRGEQGREDAEVAEAVRAYRAHVGGLRAVVGAVNAVASPVERGTKAANVGGAKRDWGGLVELMDAPTGMVAHGEKMAEEPKARSKVLPAVPEVAAAMPVRTAAAGEGAVVSTQACGLCGMKREERVAKVDAHVEDSFGEWWMDKTNLHVDCWRFWEGFKGKLHQR